MSKLLLTTSNEGMLIIADVPQNHTKDKGEMFVSQGFLKANQKDFVDMTDKIISDIENILPLGWAYGDRYSDAQWIGPERY